ncbi:hypothetical protein AVEN_1571-1 [Araneus ventricosus]|uniref:Uncharacterized protein n=1 Tax=Araneus ventricosus TaxID=182803 RepID=A0A4Y2DTM5_ARAVE|nr:hypothetical protein AVEN_1571-1 [Araneus ventricosus]
MVRYTIWFLLYTVIITDQGMVNYMFLIPVKKLKNAWREMKDVYPLMERLDSMLRAISPFIECYLQMHRISEGNSATNIRMVFMENEDLDLRRYNHPTSKTEIAAIFV